MERNALKIRENRPEDSSAIYLVYVSAIRGQCTNHYSKDEIENLINTKSEKFYVDLDKRFQLLVGEINNAIVAFGAVDTKENCIINLFVSSDYNGNGYASSLIAALESILIEKGAKTIFVNSTMNAVSFYKKMGYTPLRQIKHCIGGHYEFNAIAMIKNIYPGASYA